MESVLRRIGSFLTTSAPTLESPTTQTTEENDFCLSCSNPCDKHEQIPPYLAKKINQTKELAGTVKPYGIHIVLCGGNGTEGEWSPKIEKDPNTYAFKLNESIKANKDRIPTRVLITTSDIDPIQPQDDKTVSDLLIFPHMIRYNGVTIQQITDLIEDQLISGKVCESIPHQTIEKKHIALICAHKKRDKRCAVAGSILADEFAKVVKQRNRTSEFLVAKVSHFGGHKFAGNVIAYPRGDWFGRVTACYVEGLVDLYFLQGRLIPKLYRGSMQAFNGGSMENKESMALGASLDVKSGSIEDKSESIEDKSGSLEVSAESMGKQNTKEKDLLNW